jgi:hypothetical protein
LQGGIRKTAIRRGFQAICAAADQEKPSLPGGRICADEWIFATRCRLMPFGSRLAGFSSKADGQ